MPDNPFLPNVAHAPARVRRSFRTCALALAFAACSVSVCAQGRKPTVEDQTETQAQTSTAAGSQANAAAPPAGDAKQAVRARRVNTNAPQSSTNTTPAAEAASAPATTVTAATTNTAPPAASDAATKAPASIESAPKEVAPKESAPAKAVAAELGAGVEAELEALRAKALEAKTDADRAFFQRMLADRLVQLNRPQDAVTVLRAMMREERFDPVGFYNVGNALARLDDTQAAVEAYRKAVAQKNGNYSRALNNLGVVLIRLGHWEEAAEALTAALRLESGNYAEASYNMGRLYALRGEQGRAISEWTRTLTLDYNHTDAAVALARAYAEEGEAERGLRVLDNIISRFAHRGATPARELEVARGEIIASRNLSPAERSGAVASDERSGGATVSRPAAANSAAPLTSASASLNAAPRLAPSSSRIRPLVMGQQAHMLLLRAREEREAGRFEQSVELYRRVLSQQGGYFAPANLELGFALTSLQRHDEAVAALHAVATREGERYPVAFYHLGRLYERANKLDLAAEAFSRAAALYGDKNPQMLLDISRVHEKAGNARAALNAMEDYVRALERLGSVPEWALGRVAQLRQKAAPAQAPAPKQ